MLNPVETVISLKAVAGNWTRSYMCLGTIEKFQCY